jgi:predicted secreted protein
MSTEIALRPGETYAVPLEGRGSAGYSWSYTISGDSHAVVARIEGLSGPPSHSGDRPAAGSVQEQLVVTAVSPGKANIELVQRRSWEQNKAPLAEQTIVVTVERR